MKHYAEAPTIKQFTEDILYDLRLLRISEAQDSLSMLMQQAQDSQAKAELEELRHNHGAMLDFLMQGGEDSNRAHMQADIAARTWTLLIRTLRSVRLADSNDHYTHTHTRLTQQGIAPHAIMQQWAVTLPSEERYALQDTLFDLIWTSPLWTDQDALLWNDFILRQDAQVQQHLTWAVFLSAWEFPDPVKVRSLSLLASGKHDDTCLVATTALVLIYQHYGCDLEAFAGLTPDTSDCLFMSTTLTVQQEFATILASWKDHEAEMRKLQDITEQDMGRKMKEAFRIKLDYVRKRLTKGFDPNLSRMSLLHSSKFLSTCAHWFLPFDISHPMVQRMAVEQDGSENKALMKLTQLSTDCDVDKYAMCELINNNLGLAHSMTQRLQWSGIQDEAANPLKRPIKHIIQNLYRYFTNSPMAHETDSPFVHYDLLIAQERYRPTGSEAKCMDCVTTLTEAEEYTPAENVLDNMIKQYGADARALRLRGLCHEQKAQPADALRCYTQATFLEEPDVWLLEHLYTCCNQTGKHKEAATWMAKWLESTPNDRTLALRLADLYMADDRQADALKVLYRLDYNSPSDPQVAWRIVRCQLMQGNADAAEKYMPCVSESKACAMWDTLRLSAHIKFAQGQWAAALNFYTAAAHRYARDQKSTYSSFLEKWMEDEKLLLANKLAATDISLMRDALWMKLIHGA